MRVIVNEKSFEYHVHEDMIKDLICKLSVHFPYQSANSIRENLRNLFEVVIEGLTFEKEIEPDKKRNLKTGRTIKKLTNFIEFAKYKKTQTSLMVSAYDLILSFEGTGLLNGFGLTNAFGDHIIGNPERKSMKSFPTLRGGSN